MPGSLDRLVDDILVQIFQALSVHAVLSLRKTSRRYYLLSKLRCIWYARFCAEVLARNLPPPGPPRPLSLLSAAELEQRTLRALYLEQAWPRLSAKTLVSMRHQHWDDAHVDQVVFIPGGTELLTVQGDKVIHWLIVSWPGIVQGLKYIGEYTPFEGIPCRIVKDVDVPGVIAVGPREPLRSEPFAKVLSTSLMAPFVMLCDYARVPGIVVGVWRHFLLLDTTRELEGGGLELLDWHAQTTGSVLLLRPPEMFGGFLDFVVFSGHLLLVWESCVSVFPVPHVPADGQVAIEAKRVFMFEEAISRPVGFTTCVTRHAAPSYLNHSAILDREAWDVNYAWDWDGQCNLCTASDFGISPTLTIAAQRRRRAQGISMMMLIPLMDGEGRKKVTIVGMNAFPYRLATLPPHFASTSEREYHEREGHIGACTSLCLGSSGRGAFVVGRELRLVSPGLHILPPYEMQFGPVFETGPALYGVDRYQQRDSSWSRLDTNEEGGTDDWDANGDKVDFDEGMGRFVVVKERGGFEVVELA